MTNQNNNKNLILVRKQIDSVAEYQILNTKNVFNDICCVIIKITGRQIFEIGQFKNIEIAKEVLEKLNGNDYIGRKVKIKIKNYDKIYIGEIVSWTYGENSAVEIYGGEENTSEKVHLIFNKFDNKWNQLIEKLEFID
ncbi:MAG: hypothetical protein U9O55_00935 [Patescibacteria group bacterium]|nr:hypothetical protein [Patescibacteria group bacterium]